MAEQGHAPIQQPIPFRLALRVRDAAAAIGVKQGLIYKLIRTGRLEAKKVGGCTIVTSAALQAYLDSLEPKRPTEVG